MPQALKSSRAGLRLLFQIGSLMYEAITRSARTHRIVLSEGFS